MLRGASAAESKQIHIPRRLNKQASGLRFSDTHEIDPLVEEERKHLRFSHIILLITSTGAIIISDRFAAHLSKNSLGQDECSVFDIFKQK